MACEAGASLPGASAAKVGQQRRRTGPVESLAAARCRLAGALGAAGRRLWRRKDLEVVDEVVLDLVVEALFRIGNLVRPAGRWAAADAPPHIQELVAKLVPVACGDVPVVSVAAGGGMHKVVGENVSKNLGAPTFVPGVPGVEVEVVGENVSKDLVAPTFVPGVPGVEVEAEGKAKTAVTETVGPNAVAAVRTCSRGLRGFGDVVGYLKAVSLDQLSVSLFGGRASIFEPPG